MPSTQDPGVYARWVELGRRHGVPARIANFEAAHPDRIFATLNNYAKQLLETQKGITAELKLAHQKLDADLADLQVQLLAMKAKQAAA